VRTKASLFSHILPAIMLVSALGVASAQDAARDQGSQAGIAERRAAEKGVLRLLPADSVTEHSINTARGPLAYTATAGTLAFYDQSGEQSASVFYTAYVAKNGQSTRPLTFVFNGGPGAASAFLHLGLVGPRVLDFGPDGHDATRAVLRDNPDTWLSFTDLVLIDPVGTGWSRTVKPDDGKNFWSIRSDASSMARVMAASAPSRRRAHCKAIRAF
jgi:carboxypeptidase C (cathepsin A)